MKYRYITQVMTRHSGMLSIFCRDLDQAMENVESFKIGIEAKLTTISFDSISELPNCMLLSEIISVSITDMELQRDIPIEEAAEAKKMAEEMEYPSPSNDNDGGYG